jgi:hypothetical protein
MSEANMIDLVAQLKDAEESAVRSIRERDKAVKEAEQYKLIATEAAARNPAVITLRMEIKELEKELRLEKMNTDNAKLEIKLLRKKIKLLKEQKKDDG